MPKVTAVIEGREYSFVPLSNKDAKNLTRGSAQLVREIGKHDIFSMMEFCTPFIEASMKGAGNDMPDLGALPFQPDSVRAFDALLRAVMQATGLEAVPLGEALPARTNGTSSTASSSPLPDGVSTISTSSHSTT